MALPMHLAPCVPHWVMIEREAVMQIDDRIIHCAAFLGEQSERGFVAEGTCFFINLTEDELSFVYVITARHIIKPFLNDRTEEPNPNSIWIRLQRNTGPPRLIETKRHAWVCHKDRLIDICILPFDLREWDDDDVRLQVLSSPGIFMTKETEEHFGFGLGSDVFIPSVFVGRVGERQNIPVARVGTIAAMPLEPVPYASPRKPAFLIETKSLGGTSGAPVFFHTDPARSYRRQPAAINPDTGHQITPYFLIGMVVSHHSGQYRSDFTESGDESNVILPKDVDFNAGISVALPIAQVMEVIEREDLRDQRAASVKANRDASGYRPSSQ